MFKIKNNQNNLQQRLDKKKMLNRITIPEFLISNTIFILMVFLFSLISTIIVGVNRDIFLTFLIIYSLVALIVKINLYMNNRVVYEYDILNKQTVWFKIIKIINPSIFKQTEKKLTYFSNIGYYFNEDISFIDKILLDNFLMFDNNISLKRYINLINSDGTLSKELSKIMIISNDYEFKLMNDKYKSQIISDLFLNLIKTSIPKIIEYNLNHDKKIKFELDAMYTDDAHADLENMRVINRKLFKLMGEHNYSFQSPDILKIFMQDDFLNQCGSISEVENYVKLFREFNNQLEIKYNLNKEKEYSIEDVSEFKDKILKKYNLMIEN